MDINQMVEIQKRINAIIPKGLLEMLAHQQKIVMPLQQSLELAAIAKPWQDVSDRLKPFITAMDSIKKTHSLIFDNERLNSFIEFQKQFEKIGIHTITRDQDLTAFTRYNKLFNSTFSKINPAVSLDNSFLEQETPKVEIEKIALINYDLEELIENSDAGVRVTIANEFSNVKRIITDIYRDQRILLSLEARSFEKLIAELLHQQGFDVELTKQTRDNGYDIIAMKKLDSHRPIKFLVECKRYKSTRPVGVDIIRSFKEVIETEGANRGIIATTSYFTKESIKKETERPYKLELKDKNDIMQWVFDYYRSTISK